jgi:DNA-binding protein HU-beta
MTKGDFTKKVKEALELTSLKVADEVIDKMSALLVDLLKEGEEVSFGSLGKLSVTERAARKGRNPMTGEEIDIPAKKAIKLKVSNTAKKMINS